MMAYHMLIKKSGSCQGRTVSGLQSASMNCPLQAGFQKLDFPFFNRFDTIH